MVPVLRQCREVTDQSGLTARERVANLSGALEVEAGAGRLLEGGRALLVDDLMTTGASLTEASRALRAATGERFPGFPEPNAAVVATQPFSFEIKRN